jgi:GDP/UDP-N,N'-diacetylbacillosamine 2-epimerase (hydrolysing)
MKRKILVTTGTRAEYGILRPILNQIIKSRKLQLILVVTGTHLSKKYGYTINEIKKDGFHIHEKIPMIPKDDTNYSMSIALGENIIKFSKVFKKFNPDINLILGDRDEMLASALAASHMNIPNAHIHGGDISGGIDEYIRHAITKLSNIHFAATKKSKERIIRMGENPKYVFNTGSPSIDEIIQGKISLKKNVEKKYSINFNDPLILLVQHSVTTESRESNSQIIKTLKAIVRSNHNTFTIAPNSDAGSKMIFNNLKIYSKKNKFIKMYSSIPRSDYLCILKNCSMLIGNSSSGIVESSIFNTPVINLGLRQKNREKEKTIIDLENPSSLQIYHEITAILEKKISKHSKKPIYGNGKASIKISKYLENIVLSKNLIQKQISY